MKSTKYFDILPSQTYSRLYNNNYPIPVAGNTKLTFANLRLKERAVERHTLHFNRINNPFSNGARVWIFVVLD